MIKHPREKGTTPSGYQIEKQNIINFLSLPDAFLLEVWRDNNPRPVFHLDLSPFTAGAVSCSIAPFSGLIEELTSEGLLVKAGVHELGSEGDDDYILINLFRLKTPSNNEGALSQ
jgi:hypothetical protein